MGAALLVCRVVLAGVFICAGVAKLADLAGSRRAVISFGVPERLAGVVGTLLPVAELIVGVALIPAVSAPFGALGAAALLICFAAAIGNALAHGRSPDCHCFGQVHSAPAGWGTLARDLVLLAVAGFIAIGGWRHAGISATQWTTEISAAWLVAIAAGVLILGLVFFQVWFSLQLLAQNGRTLGRMDALEARLAELGGTLGLAHNNGTAAELVRLGQGLTGAGLPVGTRAPAFELEGVDGRRYSLDSLLASDRRLMLVFSAATCGPCEVLMPRIASWQREHGERLGIAVIASGDRERIRAKAVEHSLEGVLLQMEREVADAYRTSGTPTAVVIDRDGRIASPTVGGADAITTLVAQATVPALAIRHVPSTNGHGNGALPSHGVPSAPDRSRVGERAPDLVLEDLVGGRVALDGLFTERTVAIFWNPGCGFCQRMLPDLKAFEDDPPEGSPRLVVISSGDAESVREQQIHATVLLDPVGQAMQAFAAGGTPMGVLVDDGRLASPVAAGADAVFDLIRTATVSPALSEGGR